MICHYQKAYKVFSFSPNICIGILPHAHPTVNDFINDGFLTLKTMEHKDFCIWVPLVQQYNDFTPFLLKVRYFIDISTLLITLITMVDNNTLFRFILFDFLLITHY